MDGMSQNINNFESLLKNRLTNQPLALYAGSEAKNTTETSKLCAKELLANVARQVKLMQHADTVGCKRVSSTLNKYKKREFLRLNEIPVYNETPQKLPTKFETQCVTDSQLINVVEDAEFIDKHRGATQEFDKTFCQKSDNDSDKPNDGSLKSQTIRDTDKCKSINNISKDNSDVNNKLCKLNSQDTKMLNNSDLTCAMVTVTCCDDATVDDEVNLNTSQETQGFNKCVEIFDVSEVDTERSASPVLNTIKRSPTPPLIVDLYAFEKFEDLAHPIIEEHADLKLARNMINSQIIGREISISENFTKKIGRDSPVLSKFECITTNMNKEEVEKICTCSSECVDRDVQYNNESYDVSVYLGIGNKKTESKIKTEVKDEILFSSDEEYEYLHKNVQELPLTCALETSFYDRSDVLDKTMYVGFQTASNKSIQINTDSFTKAKSILSDIENEDTGKTLSDLVEIFDTGKAVSGNEEWEKLNKLEHDLTKVEKDDNKDLTQPSSSANDKGKDDTQTFLCFEREEEAEYDVVMSQIIQCKNIKLNNSIISDRKMSETVSSSPLEPNNEIDDDTIMSQVIQFKSISRTPNIHNLHTASIGQDSLFPNAGIAKRKFEGFKTASDKKIKLSDKALARCKKVFQDIDLGGSEYVSCISNIGEAEENFLDDLKSQDFNVSYNDSLKPDSGTDPVSIVNLCDNVSDAATPIIKPDVNDGDSEIDLRVKEELLVIKDVDLQINDKMILQEFGNNEMPFEETNNNALVGFETASNKKNDLYVDAVARANDCESATKTAENVIAASDKSMHVFKKPADFWKSSTNQTKPLVNTLGKDENKDRERCNSEKPLLNELIGFKTASHKEITVSERAMEKTKDVFKDIDEEVIRNIDNKDKINLNIEKDPIDKDDFNCGIDTQDFLADELTRIEDLFKGSNMEIQNTTSPTFRGFQTANHKPIDISEKALENSKKLLEDITKTEIDIKCHSIENKVNKYHYTFKKSRVTSNDNANSDKSIFNGTDNKAPVFTGFLTASNKKVVVSDTAIKASRTLFQDIVFSQQENIGQNEEATEININKIRNWKSNIPASDNKASHISEPASQNRTKFTNHSTDTHTEPPTFVGFRTASAKPIHISANAMEKTKRLLSEFELKDGEMFDKAYGQTDAPSMFVGFQTASDKKITVSAKAPAESKMLNDVYLRDYFHKDNDFDENLADNTVKTEPKNIQRENDKTDDPYQNSSSKFIGFQTANNREVNISNEALSRSKKIFQDVGLNAKECDVLTCHSPREEQKSPVLIGFKTASNNIVSISEKPLEKSKELFHSINNDLTKTNIDVPVFKGFQTASNKKLEISEKALAKSRKLFQDLNLIQLDKDPKSSLDMHENGFGLFQTGNKIIEVSEQKSIKEKDIIKNAHDEHEDDSLTNDRFPAFKGFQTASKKKVPISEVALAKSKRLFEDMNLSQLDKEVKITEDIDENNFVGFQTANSKRVKVSEQALAKTKDVFKDIHLEKDNVMKDITPVFKGFQTASNKKVEISEKALAKSKQVFEDLNLSQVNKDKLIENNNDSNEATKNAKYEHAVFKGFHTASNKKVVISESALSKCKQLFEDMNLSQLNSNPETTVESNKLPSTEAEEINKPINNFKNNIGNLQTDIDKKIKVSQQAVVKSKNVKDIQSEYNVQCEDQEIRTPDKMYSSTNNVHDVIDTQVLNDFQETLNTEDFCKSTPTSKRSGSPILSCPRAKKRKFETPYRTSKKVEPKKIVAPKLAKTYSFDDNYKKDKKYTLKDIDNLEKEHTKSKTDPCIDINFENLLDFKFIDKRNDYTTEKITVEDVKKTFLGSVNKKIVPEGWLDNHIKLIIWKLLSYEVKFPNLMKNTCTVKNVLEQLKYRYDRELYHVQRPILRKILEKDEVASKTMVLCVAALYADNVNVASVSQSSQNVELLLTDGWYCVKACLDRMLVRLVASGSIAVGTKIAVCGAVLMNCDQGVAPWEDTSSIRLKLHGNSTRRARWYARLGLCTDLIQCPLGTAKAEGGKMAATRVVVTRAYPPLYVEKMDDGSTVTLSERLEQIRQMKYESERQIIMEKLYEEVEKEMSDQDSQDSEGFSNEKCMESGSQISRNMRKSNDPDEYRCQLTKSQNRLLEDHDARQRERLMERVRAKIQAKLDKNGLKADRNVVPLLKVRVASVIEKAGKVEITKGYLSIWKPSAAVLELVTEGSWVEILNVIPTGIRNSEIQLSAGRQTIFNPYKQTNDKFKQYTNTLHRKCYEIKEITQNPTTDNEIDTVGMIFCIEPSTKDFKEQSFQNVYLADADKNIICVNFWGGLKKFGFENVLDTGQIITCVNLQKRAGNTRKSIQQYRVTEFSYFTKTPKSKKALEITNELISKLSKVKDKFCEDCLVLKNNYSIFKRRDSENVSPYRFDYNLPKNMVSPLKNCDTNLNLTGLDFESSFNSQEISPQLLLRKKRVNEKIEKIRLNYGEPPPLSSIHIINKSKNASATYKSPLVSNLERSKMAESPRLENVASPVTANRTFVKNVHPVKLNFSRENLDEHVDHFAEDFDASPPLSLDSDTLN